MEHNDKVYTVKIDFYDHGEGFDLKCSCGNKLFCKMGDNIAVCQNCFIIYEAALGYNSYTFVEKKK